MLAFTCTAVDFSAGYLRRFELAAAGPIMGSKDHFTGLGVFFDTYNNDVKAQVRMLVRTGMYRRIRT